MPDPYDAYSVKYRDLRREPPTTKVANFHTEPALLRWLARHEEAGDVEVLAFADPQPTPTESRSPAGP